MSKTVSTLEADTPLDLEEELQARVAWHYYVGNLTQQEIAERIGSNRARVNRLLAASRESGLVQVTINSRIAPCVALEERLAKRFGLERAVVVPAGVDRDTTQAALGIGAAQFLSKELRAGQTVGLGWGRTIRATLRAMPHRNYGPLAVVSMQGGLPHCPSINTFDIVSDFADICQAEGFLFAAPIYVSSQKARDIILQEDAVRETYDRARCADLAVLTCGDLAESLVMTYGIGSPEQRRALKAAGAVGDLLGHFMDAHGEPIDHPLNRRTVAVSLADLRSIQRVVLVSGGEQKYEATRAALRGGYPSVLVTDECTAQRLCNEPETAVATTGAKNERRIR